MHTRSDQSDAEASNDEVSSPRSQIAATSLMSSRRARQRSSKHLPVIAEDPVIGRARFSFRAREAYQLSFSKGDLLIILQRGSSWWFAEKNGLRGRVPATYIQVVEKDGPELADEREDESSAATANEQEASLAMMQRELDRTKELLLVTQQESIAKSKLIHKLSRDLSQASLEIAGLRERDRQATRLAAERQELCAAGLCVISAVSSTRTAIRARSLRVQAKDAGAPRAHAS